MPKGIPFGRYRLVSLLGEGGMAKVYRAVLSGPMGFEKEVALKRLDPRLTADDRLVRSLINEARLGGQLRHKNIVEIYEFNQVEGNYYLAMEHVDGWTLDMILMKVRGAYELLPGSVVLELLAGILAGLTYAHGLNSRDGAPMNLVHRDMKPGNIIVSRAGDVKLLDFGIAKADTNLYKTTAADVTKGTPIYMSPEQVTGQALDRRSDLFSLGSIIHEMVTLEVPFQGDNLLAIMHAVLNAEVAEGVADVTERFPLLGPVMARCMQRAPEDRYGSAAEIEKELRTIRRQMAPGPTLAEWIEEVGEALLPAEVGPGDFGVDGPPRPLAISTGEGSSSDATGDGEDSWQWVDSNEVDAVAASGVNTGAASYAETLDVVDSANIAPIGSMTADFFTTDGGQPPHPRGIEPTRVQKTIPGRARRRRKKSGGPLIVGLSVVAILLSVVLAATLLSDRFRGPQSGLTDVVTTDDATGAEPVAAPDPAPTVAPDPTPTVAAKPDPTPGPATRPDPTPTVRRDPTPAPVAKPEATPAPVAVPTPAVVVVTGTGLLNVNSKPWSNLYLDGRFIGQTPKIGYEVPAGRHTLEFHCGSCDPARKESATFTLEDGGSFKKILRFDDQ